MNKTWGKSFFQKKGGKKMRTLFRIVLVAFIVGLSLSFAQAQIIPITVPLSGDQEVPPVVTAGTGTGILSVNLATREISGTVTFAQLSTVTTEGHVHSGAEGVNGPIIITLTGGLGVTAGTMTLPATILTPAQLNALRNDNLYLNIHTTTNPNGEIRGQIFFPGSAQGLIQWKEIHGIIQPGNLVGSGTGQVAGGTQPWTTTPSTPSTRRFRRAVSTPAQVNIITGDIRFLVIGLVQAGGNDIGTTGNVIEVKGTLVCDTDGSATGNSVLIDTSLVPLSDGGDAAFIGTVTLDPLCLSEPDIAFLIRTSTDLWIANGAIRID
jgi:CHRD domain